MRTPRRHRGRSGARRAGGQRALRPPGCGPPGPGCRSSTAKTGCGCRSRAIPISRPGSLFSTRSSAIPRPTRFGASHDFRRTIEIPGFHATTWYDIFQTSVIAAFNDIQARVGNQLLWIGPNDHYFIYETNFWPRDPVFRVVRLLVEGQADRHHGPAAGALFAARVGRRTRRLRRRRLASCRALAAAGRACRSASICAATAACPPDGPDGAAAQLRLRSAPADPDARRAQHADRCRAARSASRAGASRLRADLPLRSRWRRISRSPARSASRSRLSPTARTPISSPS